MPKTIAPIRVALLQSRAHSNRQLAIADLDRQIASAAAAGSQIICTQELCLDEYFCRTQNPDFFALAESIPGPLTAHYSQLAKEHSVVLVVSLFEKCAPGLCYNTAIILDADGTLLGKYRKMHIPQDPGFEEKFYFAPGDLGFQAFTTRYGRIGVIICWDQWFPEAARLTALKGAELILCPTAIGGLASEGAALAAQQRAAWQNVQKAHAVANGCYYAAVNRTGQEGEISFWGASFCCDFYGEILAQGSYQDSEIVTADCDFTALEEHRRMWPFFRDRRIDAYSHLNKRFDT